MTGDDDPVHHCEVTVPVDIPAALEAAAIEALTVDDHRTVAIFQQAILMLIVTDGGISTVRAFDLELWNPPPNDPDFDSDTVLERFIEELLTATDATRVESREDND